MAFTIVPFKSRQHDAMQTIQIVSDGAGTLYLPIYSMLRTGQANFGLLVQFQSGTGGATVTPSLSLGSYEPGLTPNSFQTNDPATLPWHALSATATGALTPYTGYFGNSLKLVFSAAGSAWIGIL